MHWSCSHRRIHLACLHRIFPGLDFGEQCSMRAFPPQSVPLTKYVFLGRPSIVLRPCCRRSLSGGRPRTSLTHLFFRDSFVFPVHHGVFDEFLVMYHAFELVFGHEEVIHTFHFSWSFGAGSGGDHEKQIWTLLLEPPQHGVFSHTTGSAHDHHVRAISGVVARICRGQLRAELGLDLPHDGCVLLVRRLLRSSRRRIFAAIHRRRSHGVCGTDSGARSTRTCAKSRGMEAHSRPVDACTVAFPFVSLHSRNRRDKNRV